MRQANPFGDTLPTILFGAFDRHNLGDLLFPHLLAALLPHTRLIRAGLAERDLRRFGGHKVHALATLARELGGRPLRLIHVGGELLTCDAWQAAVMLQTPEAARGTVARLDARPVARAAWAREVLGLPSAVPYAVARAFFPGAAAVIYNAVGGVGLADCPPALRAEVIARLGEADAVGVRDRHTLAHALAAGIDAQLMPDPAVMTAVLFGAHIRRRGRTGAVAAVRRDFPQGHLAVQVSADFGDDGTLAEIATGLDRAATDAGCGVVLFRAGAAPWHDDLDCLGRLAARLRVPCRVFASLHVADICALIAASRGYCGSSLHGRIVAMAFALPRVNLLHPSAAARSGKQAAFAETWEPAGVPAAVGVDRIADGIAAALAVDPQVLAETADGLVAAYRHAFHALLERCRSGHR